MFLSYLWVRPGRFWVFYAAVPRYILCVTCAKARLCGFVHLTEDIAIEGLRFVLAVFPFLQVNGG